VLKAVVGREYEATVDEVGGRGRSAVCNEREVSGRAGKLSGRVHVDVVEMAEVGRSERSRTRSRENLSLLASEIGR
jgi:hypothetical protein